MSVNKVVHLSHGAMLTPDDIEADGGPKVSTQYVWLCTNRYNWKSIALKIGRNLRYRPEDWEAWKQSRRASEVEAA